MITCSPVHLFTCPPDHLAQVGPDIHLVVEGRFHLPDVAEEHMERLFKNFQPSR